MSETRTIHVEALKCRDCGRIWRAPCEHIVAGGDYEIIDSSYDDFED